MKMAEFLALSDEDKMDLIDYCEDYKSATDDAGICSQCGKRRADIGDFCWGCRKLICEKCVEKEPHYSQCFAKE